MEDHRLSRSERTRIRDLLSESTEREVQIVHSRIFTLARGATVDPETAGVINSLGMSSKSL